MVGLRYHWDRPGRPSSPLPFSFRDPRSGRFSPFPVRSRPRVRPLVESDVKNTPTSVWSSTIMTSLVPVVLTVPSLSYTGVTPITSLSLGLPGRSRGPTFSPDLPYVPSPLPYRRSSSLFSLPSPSLYSRLLSKNSWSH